ncbi:two pore domain potassium channel family protein [Mycobacterium sp. KBS0706]|nr:two pore domain potassium channel family protein [Mycobacterium sp. KBS0706]
MYKDLALGTGIISMTVLLHTIGLMILTRVTADLGRWCRLNRHALGRTISMVATVLGLFAIHTVEIWLWALAYVVLGAFTAVHDALYFSTTTFSTIGYGDLVLDYDWRLLGALEGVSGFLLIGWSTAYLVAASTRHGPFRLGEHF